VGRGVVRRSYEGFMGGVRVLFDHRTENENSIGLVLYIGTLYIGR